MKSTVILLIEMLTCMLMLFFLVLSCVTPWCAWRIICIVLCSIFGVGFITAFILSKNPKFQPKEEEEKVEEIQEETKEEIAQ